MTARTPSRFKPTYILPTKKEEVKVGVVIVVVAVVVVIVIMANVAQAGGDLSDADDVINEVGVDKLSSFSVQFWHARTHTTFCRYGPHYRLASSSTEDTSDLSQPDCLPADSRRDSGQDGVLTET